MAVRAATIESQLFHIIREFLRELHADTVTRAVILDASLERDLGVDSLGRVELFHRVEQAFGINIADADMLAIETVNDLLQIVIKSHPTKIPMRREVYQALEQTRFEPTMATTLLEALSKHAELEPNRPHVYLQDEQGNEEILSYGQLYEGALRTAAGIHEYGVKPGETVAIMLPTSLEFFYAFMGVLFAGAIPVPIYPPVSTRSY